MSDLQNTTGEERPITEPTIAPQADSKPEELSKAEPSTDAPVVESSKPEETHAATETKDESAPAEEKKDEAAAEKHVEPITEGQLSVKGPGLLKSIIPSKKEFWLSDDAVSPQDLNSYMRGEKPEIAHAVVAWASQTGKGLLFFNKKGDTTRKQPGHVLALYDATDVKRQNPSEITFKLNGQEHVLKAASDAERDGWYKSIENAVEVGKASKEEIRESEGYKAEMEKLNKPNVAAGGAAAAATKRSQSQPKKSTEVDKADSAQRKNSDLEDEDKKEQKKSRSASRGIIERLKSKKDEKKEEKEEKKTENEETKPEDDSKAEEATAGAAAVAGIAAGATAVEGASSEDKKDETTESPVESTPKTEEKSKKRGSIFGKMQAGWGSMKSPTKEKEQKDAELKPETPAKDAEPVSENPPQIPDTTTESAVPTTEEIKTETEVKPATPEEKKDATTPGKEKSGFLSGLSFINKRNRSVSPSTNMKEAPATTEAAPAEVPKEAEPVEPGKTDEAVAETTGVEPLKPEEKTEKTDKESRRQSVLGSLGRRASKAFKGIQGTKKENTAPSTEAKKEETAEAAPVADTPITNGETKPAEPQQPTSIGDVVPEAVNVGKPEHQPAAVTASA